MGNFCLRCESFKTIFIAQVSAQNRERFFIVIIILAIAKIILRSWNIKLHNNIFELKRRNENSNNHSEKSITDCIKQIARLLAQ